MHFTLYTSGSYIILNLVLVLLLLIDLNVFDAPIHSLTGLSQAKRGVRAVCSVEDDGAEESVHFKA